MVPREEVKQEPEKTPKALEAEPKPRRFRIVKLEERIAPRSGLQKQYDDVARALTSKF